MGNIRDGVSQKGLVLLVTSTTLPQLDKQLLQLRLQNSKLPLLASGKERAIPPIESLVDTLTQLLHLAVSPQARHQIIQQEKQTDCKSQKTASRLDHKANSASNHTHCQKQQ